MQPNCCTVLCMAAVAIAIEIGKYIIQVISIISMVDIRNNSSTNKNYTQTPGKNKMTSLIYTLKVYIKLINYC